MLCCFRLEVQKKGRRYVEQEQSISTKLMDTRFSTSQIESILFTVYLLQESYIGAAVICISSQRRHMSNYMTQNGAVRNAHTRP